MGKCGPPSGSMVAPRLPRVQRRRIAAGLFCGIYVQRCCEDWQIVLMLQVRPESLEALKRMLPTTVGMTMPGTEGGAWDNLMAPIATITVDLIGTYAYPAGYELSYRWFLWVLTS